MPEPRRGWALALSALCAVLLGAAIAAIAVVAALSEEFSGGVSFSGEDDPVFVEWVRLQGIMQGLTMAAPGIAIAAGLALVAVLLVLAKRWEARFVYRAVDSE